MKQERQPEKIDRILQRVLEGIPHRPHPCCPCIACFRAFGLVGERWVPIDGWPYDVSDRGRVRRSRDGIVGRAGTVLSPPRERSPGYAYVHLQDGTRTWRVRVHELVCVAFHGPRPSGHEVSHQDHDPTNNQAANLKWLTKRDHVWHDGQYGTGHHAAKLDPEKVRQIRHRTDSGESFSAVARSFGVNCGTVWRIAKRKTWKHVTESCEALGTIP